MDAQYALAVLGGGEVAKLNELDQLFLSEGGDTSQAYEFKPTRITAAAGGAKMFQDQNGESIPAPLEGYVIDAVRTRAYWPVKDGNKIPFCSSSGSVFGVVNPAYTEEDLHGAAAAHLAHPALIQIGRGDPLLEKYECGLCPLSQFGSAHQGAGDGSGQACKAKVMLLFLPVGWHQPCLLSVSTMSMKPWSQYASSLKQTTGREFFAFRTRISIEKQESKRGNPYGLLKFEKAGAIDNLDIARAVLALRKELRQYLYSREVANQDDDVVDAVAHPVERMVDPMTGEILEAA